MSTFKGDIRYVATCKKCKAPMGDWALKLLEEERLCWNCRQHDIRKIPYKKGSDIT